MDTGQVWLRRWRNLLILCGIALSMLQFFRAFHGERTTWITNDGDWYYASCASLYLDRDLDLSNQFNVWAAQTGETAPDIRPGRPTPTAFTIGASLLWMPAFAIGDVATLIAGRLGVEAARDGYSMAYQLSVALATLFYGLLGVWFALKAAAWWMEKRGRGWPPAPGVAALTALSASPALYYFFFEPTMSHGPGILATSLLVWMWLRTDAKEPWPRWAVMGAVGGLAALIRPQDSLLLLLPLTAAASGGGRRTAGRWLATIAAAGLVFLPQMVIWQQTHGRPLVIPQGPGYLNLWNPHPLQVWFSHHHGLFTWTPVWLFALLGLGLMAREARGRVVAMLAVFLLESYINSCTRDWWAGDAYGSRRFLSLFPVFVLGLSAFVSEIGQRHSRRVLAIAGAAIAANLGLMFLYVTGRIAHG